MNATRGGSDDRWLRALCGLTIASNTMPLVDDRVPLLAVSLANYRAEKRRQRTVDFLWWRSFRVRRGNA